MSQEQTINDIALKVGRLEIMQETNTKAIADMANSINRLVDKLDKSDDLAREAHEKSKSAHKRLDKIESNQTWLWRTIGGAVLVAIVGFIISGGLKP